MAKQTSVDWLYDVYQKQGHILPSQFEMALKMHREQIEKAYMSGTAQFDNAAPIVYPLSSTEYYNQTYGE